MVKDKPSTLDLALKAKGFSRAQLTRNLTGVECFKCKRRIGNGETFGVDPTEFWNFIYKVMCLKCLGLAEENRT